METNNQKTKICSKCNQPKLLSEYRKQKSSPDGLQYECKTCIKNRANKYYNDNYDKIKARVYAWREKKNDKNN